MNRSPANALSSSSCALRSRPHVAANAHNLSVSTYVQPEDTRQPIDIRALNAEIADAVARQAALRAELDALVASLETDP